MSYTTQAKLKPHKKNVWCMASLTRLFGNALRGKKKKSLKILNRIHWPKGGRFPNSVQRFGRSKWLQYLISHMQFPGKKKRKKKTMPTGARFIGQQLQRYTQVTPQVVKVFTTPQQHLLTKCALMLSLVANSTCKDAENRKMK